MRAARLLIVGAVAQALVAPPAVRRTAVRPLTEARLLGTATDARRGDEFTVLGADGKETFLSTKEKERIFVEAMQSYYFSGRQLLGDTEFDQLKEDLAWEGSDYAVLSRDEIRFVAALSSYAKGEQIMDDTEFDKLRSSLKAQGSIVAVSKEPRCILDTGICSVTFKVDRFRALVLYIPAIIIGTILWSGLTFELVPVTRTFNPLVTLLVGSPLIGAIAQYLTEQVIFVDPLIATGPCPDCGVNQRIFFGDVLGVEGSREQTETQCSNCKASLVVARDNLRVSTTQKPEAVAA